VASNSEGETEVNFTLVVQGRWALFGKAYVTMMQWIC